MHELSIARAILEQAEKRLSALVSESTIATVSVRIGKFRNVDPEALAFAFDTIKADFAALREASLEIELVDAMAECRRCQSPFPFASQTGFRCPACQGRADRVVSGQELDITGLSISHKSREVKRHA